MDPGMLASRERMLDVIPYPETHAPYDSLAVGSDSELWMRAAGVPASSARTWLVLTRSGAAAGTVTVPAGMRLLEIGRDFVLAVRRDDDDVEHVGVYPLRRQAGPGSR